MIERFYLKNCLSFENISLEFKKGLIVFTGPSGAGKSVLIDSILALFGLKNQNATVSEVTLDIDLNLEDYGIENDELLVIKGIKKEKVRYFINSQMVSKKNLSKIFKNYVSYLSQKDEEIFKSKNIIKVLDDIASKKYEDFKNILEQFKNSYYRYKKLNEEYEKIKEEEKKVNDLIEFAKYEIEKIDRVSPKIGEYEELISIKKDLSKREKIQEAITRAENIFEYESYIIDALEKIGKDSSFFDEAMNELREIFENEKQRLLELEDMDIENILNRIEELSELKRRYGSIEEAIEYREKKVKELKKYENISFEKEKLENELQKLLDDLKKLVDELSKYRKQASTLLEEDINKFIKDLKLPKANIKYSSKEMDETGTDHFSLELQGVNFKNISSGEFNRLRLAFMAAWSRYKDIKNHILILDEIDANVSGEESMGVAKILKELSKKYQIFAISHQSQLSSLANQHFLVTKEDGKSVVKELNLNDRIKEIARIISGEEITKEAQEFAKKMLSNTRLVE
ncbi:AAA family ATPase [Nitrosophilus kaiyonis]|uniref:AAA family ATPase n=1 Tax=Nitrosophilus kaiyonis TaxID=2930200 RepID=UPI0024917BC7|nr:AAA family ATPase [Nitrosophilus kaiyonis]